MKKSFFIVICTILLHFITIGCSQKQFPIRKLNNTVFDINNKSFTTNDFIVLTNRLTNNVLLDDYFNKNKLELYLNNLNNRLLHDKNKTNDALKNIITTLFRSTNNISFINKPKNRKTSFIDVKYFTSELSYSEETKPIKALNMNLYLYDSENKEIKSWNDYLIYDEDTGIWQ